MTSELRSVIDTNVVISGMLFPRSVPRQALDIVTERGRLLVSEATIAEVVEVTATITDCRDPKDNKFLELAVCGNASHLLSGDADLLALHPYQGIAIIAPQVFIADIPAES